MGQRYFSAATNLCYDDAYHHPDQIPEDAIDITEAEHQAVADAWSNNKDIVPGPDGKPLIIDKPFDFAVAKSAQQNDIRDAFAAAEVLPVNALSINWHGGYESASKLDGARRLAELAGLSTVTFFDTTNTGHELSLADAATVVMTVGADYQSKFAQKQALMQAVDALDPATATQADLDAIALDFS